MSRSTISLHLSISPFPPPPLLFLLSSPAVFSSLFNRLFQSLSLSFRLSGFIRKPIPTPSHRGAPSLHGPEPGNICPRDICVLIESPISSLIERTIGRSLSLSLSNSGRPAARLLLSPFPSDSRVSTARLSDPGESQEYVFHVEIDAREIFANGYVATDRRGTIGGGNC